MIQRCDVCGSVGLCDCRQKDAVGVGSILLELIPHVFIRPDCECKAAADEFDSWGLSGCIEKQDRIIAHLANQAKRRLGIPLWAARWQAKRWVRQAIEKAIEASDSR